MSINNGLWSIDLTVVHFRNQRKILDLIIKIPNEVRRSQNDGSSFDRARDHTKILFDQLNKLKRENI